MRKTRITGSEVEKRVGVITVDALGGEVKFFLVTAGAGEVGSDEGVCAAGDTGFRVAAAEGHEVCLAHLVVKRGINRGGGVRG